MKRPSCIAVLVPAGQKDKGWRFYGLSDVPQPIIECLGLSRGHFLFNDGSTSGALDPEPVIDPGFVKPDWPFPEFKSQSKLE